MSNKQKYIHNETTVDAEAETIDRLAVSSRRWLVEDALPLWWSKGFDWQHGTWNESLDLEGVSTAENRRARVQGRQTFTFASLRGMGISGPWDVVVHAAFAGINSHYCDDGGLMRSLLSDKGRIVDSRNKLYDQTFLLLALAKGRHIWHEAEAWALELLASIKQQFHCENGIGFVENCDCHPYQSNAHMHLFEAALEWIEACREDGISSKVWIDLAAEIFTLAQLRFIDKRRFLREFFDSNWRPARGKAGTIVEPGHQFEWAWLLARWSRLTNCRMSLELAESLFLAGARGVDYSRGVAVNTLNDDLGKVTSDARLWPQTEWLKASLILFEESEEFMRNFYLRHVMQAHSALSRYLATPKAGLWYDKLDANEEFASTPVPASSMYHIVVAIAQLLETNRLTQLKNGKYPFGSANQLQRQPIEQMFL